MTSPTESKSDKVVEWVLMLALGIPVLDLGDNIERFGMVHAATLLGLAALILLRRP